MSTVAFLSYVCVNSYRLRELAPFRHLIYQLLILLNGLSDPRDSVLTIFFVILSVAVVVLLFDVVFYAYVHVCVRP